MRATRNKYSCRFISEGVYGERVVARFGAGTLVWFETRFKPVLLVFMLGDRIIPVLLKGGAKSTSAFLVALDMNGTHETLTPHPPTHHLACGSLGHDEKQAKSQDGDTLLIDP